ncbi:MAG TPA: alpha/beta hydrolase [Steroidobacteraceae bacterium]|nr:alpha/beta hydrolase [Steroidobacteraceae bacterium]
MQFKRWLRLALVLVSSGLTACSGLLFGVANAPTYFGSQQRARDVSYGPGPRQQLDVYAPASARQLPVVVFWHGGSWATGDKADYRFVGTALAKHGVVAVLPNYRLYPAVKFPAFIEDATTAVAWVQAHAAEWGGDPQRIVLMGHSAGAHIATFVAYDHGRLRRAGADPAAIRGVIGLSGPYALDPNSDLLRTIFAAPYVHEDWQPVAHIDATVPPTLLVHGAKDDVVNLRHAEKLRDALQRAGVRVETEFYSDAGHATTLAAFAWVSGSRLPIVEQSVRFIESVTSTADVTAGRSR